MAKEVENFVKDFKATKKRLKELSPAEGTKMKKSLLANLEKTWGEEDIVQEAVKKVRLGGLASKKTADYVKLAEVSKPLKTWQAALKVHLAGVDKFTKFHDEAKELHSELNKRVTEVEKVLKKSGGTSDIATMATIKEAKRALPELKKAQSMMGTLQAHVVMYGMNFQRTVDAIVKQSIDAVTPKEFPEPLSEKNRKKTAKVIKVNQRKIETICETGYDALTEGDLKKAAKCLKTAEGLFEPLEGFQKEAKATATKMKKEVKAAKDGKEITSLMKKIKDAYVDSQETIASLKDDLNDKAKEA